MRELIERLRAVAARTNDPLLLEAAAALEAARVDAWQPIETIPAMTHVLLMHPNYGGMGKPRMTWEFSGDARGFREDGYAHWHAAPKPPAIDQARGKSGPEAGLGDGDGP